MKNNEVNRGPVLKKMLKALGLLGVVGMAGAVVLIAPLGGSGCGSSGGAGGAGGIGGMAGAGGAGALGGAGGAAVDAGTDGTVTTAAAVDVTIASFTYTPNTFAVAPGGTVTVHNNDSVPHSMTSESAAGNYTPGAVAGVSFDTGVMQPGGTATFTIPASAPHGTMIPFFCTVHLSGMQQGMITVQ